jgi:FkbM family methyltransferase
MTSSRFASDYDLSLRRVIRPRGRVFDLVVTPRYEQHYLEQSYEPLSADLIVNLLNGRELFVDVGAHCGFFSLLAATAHPPVQVVAIEPVAESCQLLRDGIARNRVEGRVETLQAAVSDREATMGFYITEASDNCGFYPHTAAAALRATEVEARTLDTVLAGRAGVERAVVKIDTEGHELAVLAGMSGLLQTAADLRLFVELNPEMQRRAGHAPEDLVAELQRLGFETFLIDDWERRFFRLRRPADWRKGCREDGYANLYCVPRERALSVAIVSHSSGLQGAERCLLGFVRMLVQDQGAACTVVLPGEGPLQGQLEALGAATLCAEIPWWCDFSEMSQEVVRFRMERGLAALRMDVLPRLEQADPDVVETSTLTLPWGAVAAALLDRPHVWLVSEYGELDHRLHFFMPFEQVLRSIAASSNLVLTSSEALRHTLFPDLSPERCRSIGLWVEPPPEGLAAAAAARPRPNRARLGVLASIIEGKDQATVVRALAELVRRGYDAELLLPGHANPEYRRLVEQLVAELGLEERVQMPGFLDNPYEIIAGVDLLVMSAPHEAFGRTGIEAALMGRPVVLASSSGAAEILKNGRDALWFEAGNPADLADKLAALLRDPGLARRLSASAVETVRERLSRTRVGALHHEILNGLSGKPNPLRLDPVSALVGSGAMNFYHRLKFVEATLAGMEAAPASDQKQGAG